MVLIELEILNFLSHSVFLKALMSSSSICNHSWFRQKASMSCFTNSNHLWFPKPVKTLKHHMKRPKIESIGADGTLKNRGQAIEPNQLKDQLA